MTALWTERYRPSTLNEYVWRDAAQREQVEKWLKAGSLPHLMLSGVQGSGKCLGGDELISIRVDITKLTDDQMKIINKYI